MNEFLISNKAPFFKEIQMILLKDIVFFVELVVVVC